MLYCSTRSSLKKRYSFRDVLFSGFAPDGGMFMPEHLPILSIETLQRWKNLSFQNLLCEISSLFIPEHEITKAQIKELISSALSSFSLPDAVRLVHLRDSLCILELFHGETLAFKDVAMTCTAHFLRYFLRKDASRAMIIVGTSGDTGSSAIRSVLGVSEVDIVVVFPRGLITQVQELQMTTSIADNVYVFAADGTSDDIDVPIRKLFADSDLVDRYALMSLNSVNWSRIMVQTAIFLYAYLKLSMLHVTEDALPELEVVVPTGGAGNITAGLIMKQMGVPLRLVAMVNANDIIHRTVQSGDFSMFSTVTHTLAPAIDIQDPYNMERVFWLLSGGDAVFVKNLMESFHSQRKTTLQSPVHQKVL
ncbi:hypothetical protein DNTS_026220 [Danionella cerebrum]|uniref:Threonine synthase N-terminal domain-containing protein n=1 Tax=Danionella cerebrum TaxID=2873325 RepID=A0A553NLF4_9TELE|nr:hypothetical protein DNTS_026220 [Danionella translucida]